MLTLRDMSTRKRHDVLWMALDFVLQDISVPTRTADIATIMRARLAFPASEMPIVLTWLKKVAPLVPEAAQTGEAVRVYGNIGRRWVWSPRARASKLGELAGETPEAYRARMLALGAAAEARAQEDDW